MRRLFTFIVILSTLFVLSDRLHVPPNRAAAQKPAAVEQTHKKTAQKETPAPAAAPVVAPEPTPAAEPTPEPAPVEVPQPANDSEADAKAFIYSHESGNVAHRYNSIGCYGLGQDCNGIVEGRCGADYACQDKFFTDYMQRRYGSWAAAKAFWQARVPIDGRDVGHWW